MIGFVLDVNNYMLSSKLRYYINGVPISLSLQHNKTLAVKNQVLYNKDKCNLNVDWEPKGYVIANLLNDVKSYTTIRSVIEEFVLKNLKKIKTIDSEFSLENYHKYVTADEHKLLIKKITAGKFGVNGIPLDLLPINYKEFDSFVSDLCDKKYTTKKNLYCIYTNNNFWIRIVRPLSNDNNPPHRDCYLSRSKRLINIYAPIAGSNKLSSLPVIDGSHLWNEEDLLISKGKAFVNGQRFTNPAIISCKKPLWMHTPNPEPGQAMIFTPYLIHGGGRNLNDDITRVSLEMRFWPV